MSFRGDSLRHTDLAWRNCRHPDATKRNTKKKKKKIHSMFAEAIECRWRGSFLFVDGFCFSVRFDSIHFPCHRWWLYLDANESCFPVENNKRFSICCIIYFFSLFPFSWIKTKIYSCVHSIRFLNESNRKETIDSPRKTNENLFIFPFLGRWHATAEFRCRQTYRFRDEFV